MTGGAWAGRLGIVLALIIIEKASFHLALFLVIAAGCAGLFLIVYTLRALPRPLLGLLDGWLGKAVPKPKRQAPPELDEIAFAGKLKARIAGQDGVIDLIAAQLRRSFYARNPEKPIAVFCLVGPPGVGKTYLGKVLAETLYGSRDALLHYDMTQFTQPYTASTLFGAPAGTTGGSGHLTRALTENPCAVVLLDEIEKAHPDVLKRFLTAWNDGFVTEAGTGAKVPTTEAIFILTSNAAADRIAEIGRNHAGSQAVLNTLAKKALADAGFAPEVLNRIDEVHCFRPMRGIDIAHVVALEIDRAALQVGLQIVPQGIDKAILVEAVRTYTADGDRFNVRDLARDLERRVKDGLIDVKRAGKSRIRLHAADARILVEAVDDEAPGTAAALRDRPIDSPLSQPGIRSAS